MDNRTLLAVTLSLIIWYGWVATLPEQDVVEEETASAQMTDSEVIPSANTAPVSTNTAIQIEDRDIPFSGCTADMHWNTAGGYLSDLTLTNFQNKYDVQPIYWWLLDKVTGEGQDEWMPYGTTPGNRVVLTNEAQGLNVGSGPMNAAPIGFEVVSQSVGSVVMRGVTSDRIEVTRTFTTRKNDACAFDLDVEWKNLNSRMYSGDVWVGVHDALPETTSRYSAAMRPWAEVDGSLETEETLENLETPQLLEGPVTWFGLSDAYFGFVLAPDENVEGAVQFSSVNDQKLHGVHFVTPVELAAGASKSSSFLVYAGSKNMASLEAVNPILMSLVDYGWFALFAKLLFSLLVFLHGILGNWGLAIISLTVLVKALFFPLTQMSFKSSQAMAAIQPELKEIREKFKDDPEELNRKMMEIFKEKGVNPMGGCLPSVVQLPVWVALYNVLLYSVELYQTEFLFLRDLSAVDPYAIVPAVVVVMMVINQQFMPTSNMDPAQAQMMKVMPLLFGFFFFTFPSGLTLYIFVNMLLTILQQWYIKRSFPAPAAA